MKALKGNGIHINIQTKNKSNDFVLASTRFLTFDMTYMSLIEEQHRKEAKRECLTNIGGTNILYNSPVSAQFL